MELFIDPFLHKYSYLIYFTLLFEEPINVSFIMKKCCLLNKFKEIFKYFLVLRFDEDNDWRILNHSHLKSSLLSCRFQITQMIIRAAYLFYFYFVRGIKLDSMKLFIVKEWNLFFVLLCMLHDLLIKNSLN